MNLVPGQGDPRWLAFLRRHEMAFNAELHLLSTGQRPVVCLPADGPEHGAGWFLTWADAEAGEWNLAHPFGTPAAYEPLLDCFPAGEEFHLLIPAADQEWFLAHTPLAVAEELIWHMDPADPLPPEDDIPIPEPPAGTTFRTMEADPGLSVVTGEEGIVPRSYLIEHEAIAAMVRVTHVTAHTVEIYIETLPGSRDRGLATSLLRLALRGFRRAGRRLVYVTSASNLASRRVAAKVGLVPYQVLARCPFRR
ncbi:MAG: GNAT family N-acetyltransferase [Candidatus Riflebacteria bacterium]|nr:GNAT family N-acetyltransferase [Candidatus Riflebacteria bacterium]